MSLRPFVHLDGSLRGAGPGETFPLTSADDHHLSRVLRLRPGDGLEVSDGEGGVAEATLGDCGVTLVTAPRVETRRTPRLIVAQALPKARKFDDVVRQVTELGVDAVVPVLAGRSVARPPGERGEKLRQRAQAVARAAAEQARSPWRVAVSELTPTPGLPDLVTGLASGRDRGAGTVLLVAHVGARGLPSFGADLAGAGTVCLAVGPEGGWTDAEVQQLSASGARVVGLGDTVLRTEHAAAAGIAVIAALAGRWN